jgi:OOP family OmpA-OmpF porin
MMNRFSRFYVGLLCLVLMMQQSAAWADDPAKLADGVDVKGSADHALIQRFKGSSLRFAEKKAFDELVMALASEAKKTRAAEGARTTLVYVMPKDVSTLETVRAYQAELAKLGQVQILFQGVNAGGREELDGFNTAFMRQVYGDENPASRWMSWNKEYRYLALQIKRAEGDMFISLYAGFNIDTSAAHDDLIPFGRTGVRLDIIEQKSREDRMVTVSASEMSNALIKTGKVALYGILFDTAKADIKPESNAALTEIGKLLKATPKLRLLVVGHTDAVGSFDSNRDLSQRRATAVANALRTQFGIDASRLQSFGASFAAPVDVNETEAGRAKNRRVELVAY